MRAEVGHNGPNGTVWFGEFQFANFGPAVPELPFRCSHRADYTLADAVAIVEWLRERDAGYPPHPKLMPDTAVAP